MCIVQVTKQINKKPVGNLITFTQHSKLSQESSLEKNMAMFIPLFLKI